MSNSSQGLSLPINMLCSGISACIAETVTIPIDTAKVRLQVLGEGTSTGLKSGMFKTLVELTKEEGFLSLFKGLSPALQRQIAFASVRLAIYEPIRGFVCGKDLKGDPPLYKKVIAGLLAGGIGITVASPQDVVKVRFQANNGLYKSTIDAYRDIVKTNGFRGLYQGYITNVLRNSIIAALELAGYDQTKQLLLYSGYFSDNSLTHILSAGTAAFFATLFGSPFDVVKTRYMNSRGTYKNAINCAIICYKNEGLLGFYKGFLPNYVRIASFNIALWVVLEQVRSTTKILLNKN